MADKTPVSISLTSQQKRLLQTLATAETNGNKSAWVVMQLEAAKGRHNARLPVTGEHTAQQAHRDSRTDGKCNPMLQPKCEVCY